MTSKPLTLLQIQGKLEELFNQAHGMALRERYSPDITVAAIDAAARVASVLVMIHDFELIISGSDKDGFPSEPE